MKHKPLPLRVAVVQMDAHLAYEDPGHFFLQEPFSDPPLLGNLHFRLDPGGPLVEEVERLRLHIARAYDRGLLKRLDAILAYCARYDTELVVFPEYSIPGAVLAPLRELAARYRVGIVAGTHLVTGELAEDEGYRSCFSAVPKIAHAIAPFISPVRGVPVSFQYKLSRSQWESTIRLGGDVSSFEVQTGSGSEAAESVAESGAERVDGSPDGGHAHSGTTAAATDEDDSSVRLGISICIDFLRYRDVEGAENHSKWGECHLIAVPAMSPPGTPRFFEASAQGLFQHFAVPIAFANLAGAGGGSRIIGFGRPSESPLAPNSELPPLPARYEGICIAELRLDRTVKEKPTSVISFDPIRPVVYSLILKADSESEGLYAAAEALSAAVTRTEFKERCREFRTELVGAAQKFSEIKLVRQRWDHLAKRASGTHDLQDLKRLASDLWLDDNTLTIPEVEVALGRGAAQALRGFSERGDCSKQDRTACRAVAEDIERQLERRQLPSSAAADALYAEVVSVLSSRSESEMVTSVVPDGPMESWEGEPGAPPAELLAHGFRLWSRSIVDPSLEVSSEDDDALSHSRLLSALEELDIVARWLTLRGYPPSWLGWSPSRTPTLVVRPGHVLLVSTIIPPGEDLRLARMRAGKPLPVAILLGDSRDISAHVPRGVKPLDQLLRNLAVDEAHLRQLSDYEFEPEYRGYREVLVKVRDQVRSGLNALQRWYAASTAPAVICGAVGDGRTTLLRYWLTQVAQDALLRSGTPVLYVDGDGWHTYASLTDYLAAQGFSGPRVAALRLAVSSGECLLALDGFDSIRPRQLREHPFFAGWLSRRGQQMTIQTSCWKESSGRVLELQPEDPKAPWLVRGFSTEIDSDTEVAHTQISEALSRLAHALEAEGGVAEGGLGLLLEDLAWALWTRFSDEDVPLRSSISESEFRRERAAWRDAGGEPDNILGAIQKIEQHFLLISENRPQGNRRNPLWSWHARHSSLRRGANPAPSSDSEGAWLSLPWETLLHFVLGRRIARELSQGNSACLGAVPFHSKTVSFCVLNSAWEDAREVVQEILASSQSDPKVAVNALVLAAKDGKLTSTKEVPWRLAGTDLRSLELPGVRLAHADLGEARFSGSKLRGAIFDSALLDKVDFGRCDLREAMFVASELPGARFVGTQLDEANFSSADLSGAELSGSVVSGGEPTFGGALLEGAHWHALGWPSIARDFSVDSPSAQFPPLCNVDELEEVVPSPVFYAGAFCWSWGEQLIAVGDQDGQLWIWSAGALLCLATKAAHDGLIRDVAFSPGDLLVATAGDDGRVNLWSVEGLVLKESLEHDDPVTGVFWESEDVLWTLSGVARRWDLKGAPGPVAELLDQLGGAELGGISPDRRSLVLVTRNGVGFGTIRLIDFESRVELLSLVSANVSVCSVDLRRQRFVTEDHQYGIRVASLATDGETEADLAWSTLPEKVKRIPPSLLPRQSWSADGRFLVLGVPKVANGDGLRVFSTQGFEERRNPSTGDWRALGVTCAPTSALVLGVSRDRLKVLDLDSGDVSVSLAPRRAGYQMWISVYWDEAGIRVQSGSSRVVVSLKDGVAYHERSKGESEHGFEDSGPKWNRAGVRYLFQDGGGVAIWDCASRSRRFLAKIPRHVPGATRDWDSTEILWPLDGQLVSMQRAVSSDVVQYAVWDSSTGEVLCDTVLNGEGSLIVVGGKGATAMLKQHHVNLLHLVDLETGAALTISAGRPLRVFGSEHTRFLVFVDGDSLRCVELAALLGELRALSPGEHEMRDLSACTTWEKELEYGSVAAVSESGGLVAVRAGREITFVTLKGELQGSVPSDADALAWSDDGRHLATYRGLGGELRLIDVKRRDTCAHVYLLADGALIRRGKEFQRLGPPNAALPELEGFYGRVGCRLIPLERCGNLESKGLSKEIWEEVMPGPSTNEGEKS